MVLVPPVLEFPQVCLQFFVYISLFTFFVYISLFTFVEVEEQQADATVTWSNIGYGPIGSTFKMNL